MEIILIIVILESLFPLKSIQRRSGLYTDFLILVCKIVPHFIDPGPVIDFG